MDEREIVKMLRQRDEAGMEALVRHSGPLLRYMIAPILPDLRDREECLSEITMRIWDRIDQFDPQKGSWNGWLTAVARNTALNHRRKGLRHGETETISEDMPSPEPTPEESVLRRERREEVRRALDRLTAEDRLLFYRKYYYLQSTAQIASELGMTERAVEGRLYRLKKRLRRQLGGEAHE